jgi:hypothetical protein
MASAATIGCSPVYICKSTYKRVGSTENVCFHKIVFMTKMMNSHEPVTYFEWVERSMLQLLKVLSILLYTSV